MKWREGDVARWAPDVDHSCRLGYRITGLPPVLREVRNVWTVAEDAAGSAVSISTTVDAGPQPPQQLIARLVGRRFARASDSMLAGLTRHLTAGATNVARPSP